MKINKLFLIATVGLTTAAIATAPAIVLLIDFKTPDFLMGIAIIWFLFIGASVYNIFLPGQSVSTSIAKFIAYQQRKAERSPAQQKAQPTVSPNTTSKLAGKRFNFVTQQWEEL